MRTSIRADYAIQLTIQHSDPPGCTATLSEPFTVYAPNVRTKAQEQEELYHRAKEVALLFTDNFDKKFDTLNKGVWTISQRMAGPDTTIPVQLPRNNIEPSVTRPIWIAIRNRTEAMSVSRLEEFLNRVFCIKNPAEGFETTLLSRAVPPFHDVHSYELLRMAVEAFLIQECGVVIRTPRNPTTGRPGSAADFVPGVRPPISFADAQAGLTSLLASRSGRPPYIEKVVRQIFQGGVIEDQYVNPFCYGILEAQTSRA